MSKRETLAKLSRDGKKERKYQEKIKEINEGRDMHDEDRIYTSFKGKDREMERGGIRARRGAD